MSKPPSWSSLEDVPTPTDMKVIPLYVERPSRKFTETVNTLMMTDYALSNNRELVYQWLQGKDIQVLNEEKEYVDLKDKVFKSNGVVEITNLNTYRIKPLEVNVGSVWLHGNTPKVVLRGDTLDDGYFLLGDVSALDITVEVTVSRFSEMKKLTDSLKDYYISRN